MAIPVRVPGKRLHTYDRLDLAFALTVAALAATALVATAVLPVQTGLDSVALDIAIDTMSAVVTGSVVVLLVAQIGGQPQSILRYRAAAFLVLFAASVVTLIVDLGSRDQNLSLLSITGSQALLWIHAGSRIFAAALLLAGSRAQPGRIAPKHPRALFALTGVAAVLGICGAVVFQTSLPILGAPFDPSFPGSDGATVPVSLPSATPVGMALHLTAAVGFLAAAELTRRSRNRGRSMGEGYLTFGLVFAAFAQVLPASSPGAYPGIVTSGDVLELVFDLCLLLGIYRQAQVALVNLQNANAQLAVLLAAQSENVILQERLHLSRELHDGLTQSLWVAKLLAGRLAAITGQSPEAATAAQALQNAVDAASIEARQAVFALRAGYLRLDGSLEDSLKQLSDGLERQSGIRVVFDAPEGIPEFDRRANSELFRIVQEALSNVRQHSEATVVHIEFAPGSERILVRIRDNGRGFDLAAPPGAGVGFAGMRERAARIDGLLSIVSYPSEGTTVTVDLPLPAAPTREGAA